MTTPAASVRIRPESPGDAAAVAALLAAAFAGHPFSDGSEPAIHAAVRDGGGQHLSLVAEDPADGLLGVVLFSPVSIGGADVGWWGLGPVAVRPDRQNRGIGRALVEAGLARLRSGGARGCVVLGDAAYYRRFGFVRDPAITLPGLPPEHFLALAFGGERPEGAVRYHPAFGC